MSDKSDMLSISAKDTSKDYDLEKEKLDFKRWLEENYQNSKTINSKISEFVRLQEIFGSLSYLYENDKLIEVLKLLIWTRSYGFEEMTERGFKIFINGEVYNVLSTLISTLRKYIKFLDSKTKTNSKQSKRNKFEITTQMIQDAIDEFGPIDFTKKKYEIDKDKNEVVDLIQKPLFEHLSKEVPDFTWSMEEKIWGLSGEFGSIRDRIDIYGHYNGLDCIIEIDTCRSDQIAKKFISRIANGLDRPVIYVIILYPNTHTAYESEKKEAAKYKKFVESIIARLSNEESPKSLVTRDLYAY